MASLQQGPHVIQWILDTRDLWPDAPKTRVLETHASRAMALLTQEERAQVLKYYHVRDAKMSLGSHLLKRYVVARYCGVPWRDVKITRNGRTKPVYVDAATGQSPLDFNVSHQAGVVALAAVHGYNPRGQQQQQVVDVGVDVVCTSERRARDHENAGAGAAGGWPNFVDVHADVLADSEANYLKYQVLSSVPGLPRGAGPAQILDFKLRCFYALWCLREAYVKMTGDALLAPWLKSLEFRNVVPPSPTEAFNVPARVREPEEGSAEDDADPGQVITRHDILFHKKPVTDANVCLQAIGPDYMCCTAVRTQPNPADGLALRLGSFEILKLEDIMSFAESSL